MQEAIARRLVGRRGGLKGLWLAVCDSKPVQVKTLNFKYEERITKAGRV